MYDANNGDLEYIHTDRVNINKNIKCTLHDHDQYANNSVVTTRNHSRFIFTYVLILSQRRNSDYLIKSISLAASRKIPLCRTDSCPSTRIFLVQHQVVDSSRPRPLHLLRPLVPATTFLAQEERVLGQIPHYLQPKRCYR